MANTQQLENAEKFRALLHSVGEATKPALLYGGSVQLAEVFKDKSAEEIAKIISDRDAYQKVESEAAGAIQHNPQQTKKDELDKTTAQTSNSAGFAAAAIPGSIYTYFFDNPDRYSAEQLEKAADKRANSEIKDAQRAAKKAKKTFTEEDKAVAAERGKKLFHDEYVLYHDQRARDLAKDPATNNAYLKRALFYKDAKKAMEKAAETAQKDKSLKMVNLKSLSPAEKTQIPKTSIITAVALNRGQPKTAVFIGEQTIASPTFATSIFQRLGLRNGAPAKSILGKGTPNTPGIPRPKLLSFARRNYLQFSVLSVLIGVVLLTAAITLLLGVGQVNAGTPPSSGGTGGNGGATSSGDTFTCSGDYIACLSRDFAITVRPDGYSNNKILKLVYDSYVFAFTNHPTYLKMFKSRTPIFTFDEADNEAANGSWAVTSSNGNVIYYGAFINCDSQSWCRNIDYQKHVVIHESGHVIAGASGGSRLQDNFYHQVYGAGLDASCFSSGVMKTYLTSAYSNMTTQDKIDESFAESLANTLMCTGSGTCPTSNPKKASNITDFPSTCSNTVNYFNAKVLN